MMKGLLLDRDGVINVDAGYVGSIDRFVFQEGIFDFLTRAVDCGYRLVVVTNQSGVARGLYSEDDHRAVTDFMLSQLARRGIFIVATYVCFKLPELSHPVYGGESFWRKPNPGMLLDAVRDWGLDPAASIMIGDKETDMQAGIRAGIGTCLWLGGTTVEEGAIRSVGSLQEAQGYLTGF